jgi:hypothetical protein
MTDATGIVKVAKVLSDMRDLDVIGKYAIGGAFAATLHAEPISTIDLDIFFLLSHDGEGAILSLSNIYDYARKEGFTFDHEFINIYGWLVQFVESSRNELWKEAVETATPINIGDLDIPVIDPEHLAAMWLFAGRAKDYQKIAIFLSAKILDEPKLFNILESNDLMLKWNSEKWRFADQNE